MKSFVVKVVLMTVISAGMYADVFALSDSYLSAIRDGFDGRRDSMLSLQVSNTYPTDDGTIQLYVWNRLDYALAALYTNQNNATANTKLIEVCNKFKANPAEYNADSGIMTNVFDWSGELLCRTYELFNSRSTYFPGRLTPDAEAAICDLLWGWAKSKSVVSDTNFSFNNNTWTFWSTENGSVSRNATIWEADQILKNTAPYNTYHYDDGYTAQQHYDAWTLYFIKYFQERAKRGLNIEIAATGYARYTLQGYYNIYDFSNDATLKTLAGCFLDLWWADWAQEQLAGVRGGSKARCYQDRPADGLDGADLHAADDGAYGMCWYCFGFGSANVKHPNIMCMATSTYRLPLVVMDIALDTSGRGSYECKSRRIGLSTAQYGNNGGFDDNGYYNFDPNFGGIYKYSYCTPSFVIGTSMLEKRPETNWVGMSDQNRWQGVIFSTNADARIVPQCLGLIESGGTQGRTSNQQWSVQNKGTLITQKLSTSDNTGPMRVYFSKKYFTAINEESGWVFVNATNAYAAVKPATGTYTWETVNHTDGGYTTHADPNWFRCSDQYAAVIIEVAQASDYTDFTAFKTAVKALSLTVVSNVVTYTGLKGNGTFTFYTNASTLPKINGMPIDLKPSFTFDSPFMHEDWASGNITIHKDGRTCQMDFNNAVENVVECGDWGYLEGDLNRDCSVDMSDLQIIINNWLGRDIWFGNVNSLPPYDPGPFSDSSTTVALWHMDSTYTGSDNIVRVADDDALNTRNHELLLGSARSGYSAATRPTLSTPGFNGTGGCLLFDGVNDETISTGAWPGYDSVLVDVWIYPVFSANSHLIVEASLTWSLSLIANKLNFSTWHSDSSSDSYNWPNDITLNTWHHVRAVMTKDGLKQLTLDGVTNTILTSGPSIKVQAKDITVGKKTAATWYFNGYIDEIRIAGIDPAGYRGGTVNLRDWAIVAEDWLKCTDPANAACQAGL